MNDIGIYIHVPFCAKKCPYCSFYSVNAEPQLMDKYTKKVCEKLEHFGKILNKKANTLYLGGGTPSILGTDRILEILNISKKYFNLNNAEITIEVNPTSKNFLDFEKLYLNGINRLSIGLQSANNNELFLLGRAHTKEIAGNTVKAAQVAGFKNISLDLMLAIQEQTKESLFESIKFCDDLNVQHISAYILSVEEGTEYHKNFNKLKLKTEDEQSELYLFACSTLKDFGFNQYEISNFCKKGYESKHNLKYWNSEEYLGIGPGAHSFINKKRFYFKNSLEEFLNDRSFIVYDSGGSEEEYALLRLRLNAGLTDENYFKRFKKHIPTNYFYNAKKYEPYGLLKVEENKSIKLSPEGFLVSNELISNIIIK